MATVFDLLQGRGRNSATVENEGVEDADANIIHVYTDGSCVDNGSTNARAGIGVYFGPDDPRNVSSRVPADMHQTNNVAELLAIIYAVELLADDLASGASVVLHSDSVYAIRCCGEYGDKLAATGWKLRRKRNGCLHPPNLELVRRSHTLLRASPGVELRHIRAHSGLPDVHSRGNDAADRLANLAVGITTHPQPRRTYLSVPYAQKDACKALGGKWDPTIKRWYSPTYVLPEALKEMQHRWGAGKRKGRS